MPIPIIQEVIFNSSWIVNHLWLILKIVGAGAVIAALKWFSMGATNKAERKLHGRVVMITGGTSGIGAETALAIAQRGAQVVLLTHLPASDLFLVDYIDDLRERSGNELIYAEHVDLSSLHSIRTFATKWIDNAPVRRLDMIVLCAATLTPPGKPRTLTREGIEQTWMVNYLANFHLLSILSPAIRAQPPDRDVRILMTTCGTWMRAPDVDDGMEAATKKKGWAGPGTAYAKSKLALMIFGHAFQKHLDAYKRPDGLPPNARVVFVDPGFARTPGMRRWLTRGTIWGLGVYMILYQLVWILLKSSEGGAQSLLHAAMEASLGRGTGGKLIKECMEMTVHRSDIQDEAIAKKLWEGSEKLIERAEREEAVRRALEKKEQEEVEKPDAKDELKKKGKKTPAKPEATSNETEGKKSQSRRQKKANK